MEKIIGLNLLIDVYNVKKNFFRKEKLLTLLRELVKLTKSTAVGKPIVKKIKSTKSLFQGYSILQIIQESHIALHTWPEYNYLAIDIFSCKKILPKKIYSYLKKFFNKGVKFKIQKYQRIVVIYLSNYRK